MSKASTVMNIAASYIGTHEDPLGSNNVIFNTDYYGYPVGYAPWAAWCCAFVWDIFRMAGASALFYDGQKTAYCPTVASWGASSGLVINYNLAKYGDIVLFDWDGDGVADHIGFVENLNDDGSLTTIEGNTSDADHSNGGYVLRRTRYRANVLCIIHPLYDENDDGYRFRTENIKLGDEGLDVFRLQVILRANKWLTGKITRRYGTATEKAVKKAQEKFALPVNGKCTADTWFSLLHLAQDGRDWVWKYVQYGDTTHTDSVRLLQEFLQGNYKKFYSGKLDGKFGDSTRKALINYCKYYNRKHKLNLPTDGTFNEDVARFMIG